MVPVLGGLVVVSLAAGRPIAPPIYRLAMLADALGISVLLAWSLAMLAEDYHQGVVLAVTASVALSLQAGAAMRRAFLSEHAPLLSDFEELEATVLHLEAMSASLAHDFEAAHRRTIIAGLVDDITSPLRVISHFVNLFVCIWAAFLALDPHLPTPRAASMRTLVALLALAALSAVAALAHRGHPKPQPPAKPPAESAFAA